MRVVPRRSKDRPRPQSDEPSGGRTRGEPPGGAVILADEPEEPRGRGRRKARRAQAAKSKATEAEAARPGATAAEAEATPAEATKVMGPKARTAHEKDREKTPDQDLATTAVLPATSLPTAPGEQIADPDQRRRARAAERRRAAAEAKRSRAAYRQDRARRGVAAPRDTERRAALLVMVITLGLLIAAVAVTGGMIAASMRTQPVALAAPLHVYPVAQTLPGQCPAGTQGITGQSASGATCYRLSQGIAIRKVADLRVQKSLVTKGAYDVAVTLRRSDRHAFAQLTRAMVGRDLAFVVRDRLVTLPRVDMAILDGKVVVTGPPTRAAADKLYHELKGK